MGRTRGRSNRGGRRKRGGRGKQSGFQSGGAITRVSFSDIWSNTWSAQSDMRTFGLTSANSGIARLLDLGQYFQFYRFTKVRFTLYPTSGGSFAMCYLGAIAGVSDITTFAEAAEVQPSILVTSGITVPKSLVINKRVLLETPTKWFPYNSGASAYQPTQGNLHLVPSASVTATVLVKVDGMLEFIRPSSGSGLDRRISPVTADSPKNNESVRVTCQDLDCSCREKLKVVSHETIHVVSDWDRKSHGKG